MSKELKPCPFCGETPIYDITPDGENNSIDCRCGESECFLDDGRLDQWNYRPIEDFLQNRIEELEAENSYLREMLNKIRVKASLHAEACECGPDAARLRLIEKESEKGLKKVGYVQGKFD